MAEKAKDVKLIVDNESHSQEQQLLMPWLVLSDQIKMLGQRMDGVERSLNQRIDGVEHSLNQRMDSVERSLNQRIDDLRGETNKHFNGMDQKFDIITQRLDKMDAKLDKRVDRLTTIVLTVAGILVTFFVTYLTLRG